MALETQTAMLRHALRFHEAYARALVSDLTPSQMVAVPGAGHENHPAFTIGHLVTALDLVAQDLGLPSDLQPGWGDLFLRKGPSDRRVASVDAPYPGRDALLDELARHGQRVSAALDAVDPAWLEARAEPWRLSEYLPGNHDVVLFMIASHAAMHLGQLSAWRRAMGLPPAMASL